MNPRRISLDYAQEISKDQDDSVDEMSLDNLSGIFIMYIILIVFSMILYILELSARKCFENIIIFILIYNHLSKQMYRLNPKNLIKVFHIIMD